MDREVVGAGDTPVGALGDEGVLKEAVSEILPELTAIRGTVKPIVRNRGTTANPIWVVVGEITEYPWNGRQIRYKAYWDRERPIHGVIPDERFYYRP